MSPAHPAWSGISRPAVTTEFAVATIIAHTVSAVAAAAAGVDATAAAAAAVAAAVLLRGKPPSDQYLPARQPQASSCIRDWLLDTGCNFFNFHS